MKKAKKIFGIGAALLLLIIGIAPVITSSEPPNIIEDGYEGIQEAYIENWESFSELCEYYDEYGYDSELTGELQMEQDEIVQEINIEMQEIDDFQPPQEGGMTWFFRLGLYHEWWFKAAHWEQSVSFFDWALTWRVPWNWMILGVWLYLEALFLFRGTPLPKHCNAMARDIIFDTEGDSYRYEVINDGWDGESGIWIRVKAYGLPFFWYDWDSWGHQPEPTL